MDVMPQWLADLETEDISFVKRFILASGSLKEIAKQYEVTYPTVRLRLDRLIQKIQLSDREEEDTFVTLVRRLVIDDKLDFETGKLLINAYKKEGKEG